MNAEKYSDAVRLTGEKYGLPDFAYQQEVVSDSEKETAMEIIKDIKHKISLLCDRIEPGKNNVIIPFHEVITAALPGEKAADMTTAKRLFSLISLSAIVNVDERPRYVLRKEGDPVLQTIPFVVFEDLRESVSFLENAAVDGVRQYIHEWYNDVFLVSYNAKNEPDSKERKGETLVEKRIGLTTEQLADATYQKQNKKFGTKQILENYVDPLVNQDKADSDLDKRNKIYYPILTSKIRKLFDSERV